MDDENSFDNEEDPLLDTRTVQPRRCKGLTSTLVYAICTCVIGTSFQFGYSTGVVNAPQEIIEEFINKSSYARHDAPLSQSRVDLVWSIVVAVWCVGGIIGGFTGGIIADKIGRKKTMLLNNIPIIVGSVLMSTSQVSGYYELLIAGRFVIGLGGGVATVLAPIYLSEVAPVHLRGAVGIVNQFTIVIAIIVSQVLGFKQILGNSSGWPFLLGAQIIPAVIQLLMLKLCPESPRYLLIKQGYRDLSEQVLYWLRKTMNVEGDLQEMLREQDNDRHMAKVTVLGVFRDPELRRPLIISIVMMLSMQFSGVNAVIYYSTEIFVNAGLSLQNAQYATLGVGLVNVAMTFVSAILVDRAGRRMLHLYGLAIMFVFADLLTVSFIFTDEWQPMSYVSIVCTVGFIVGFATGPGSIPWLLMTELFAQRSRGAASSVAVLVNWSANFVVGLVFPTMQNHLGKYSFLPFVFLLGVFWLFTYIKVPETKNRTIEEITSQFQSGDHRYGDIYSDDEDMYSQQGSLNSHDITRGSDM